jgi:hypothetical protein
MHWGTYGKLKSVDHPYRTDVGNVGAFSETDFLTVGKLDRNYGYFQGVSYWGIFKAFHFLSDRFKMQTLESQFEMTKDWESTRIKQYLAQNDELVVEVANEPNMFPYIPPKLYAKYYTMWWDFVKGINPGIKVMNGGYWISPGLPKGIVRTLPKLGVKITSVVKYNKEFLKHLDENRSPDILNVHCYPYVMDGMKYLDKRINQFTDLVYLIVGDIMEDIPVWVTEYGNINSLSESQANIFLKTVMEEMFCDLHPDQAYYFKAGGTDSKLLSLQNAIREWKAAIRGVEYLLKLVSLPPFGWVSRVLPKLFGVLTAKEALELIRLSEAYEKRPPIQGLETDGKLNSLGRVYFDTINRLEGE